PIGIFGIDAAERAPRPAVVRMPRVGQRLGPVVGDLVVTGWPVLIAPSLRAATALGLARGVRDCGQGEHDENENRFGHGDSAAHEQPSQGSRLYGGLACALHQFRGYESRTFCGVCCRTCAGYRDDCGATE